MSYRLSILGPTNVVPLQPNSQSSHATSRITSSQSRATPLSRATTTRSSRNDVVTSALRLSPIYVRDPPRQPEMALLCSGQSCIQLPEDTGSGSNHSDVTSGVDVAAAGVGWRLRWRPLDVSEYIVSDFGFQQQLLSESLGMTQRKSIRSKRELERDIVSMAHRHISACRLPGAVKPSSRAATNFENLKESLVATSGEDDWNEASPGGEWMDSVDDGNGGEWQRESGARRMRMRMSSSVVGRGSAGDDRSQRKRIGLCRGLTFVKPTYSSSSSSSSSFSSPPSAITSCRPTPLLTPRHHHSSLVLL